MNSVRKSWSSVAINYRVTLDPWVMRAALGKSSVLPKDKRTGPEPGRESVLGMRFEVSYSTLPVHLSHRSPAQDPSLALPTSPLIPVPRYLKPFGKSSILALFKHLSH